MRVRDHREDEKGVVFYIVEVKVGTQEWRVLKRYSEFDDLHSRLKKDLEPRDARHLPKLPKKKLFFTKDLNFIKERAQGLNEYMSKVILLFQALENPFLQKFLELDQNYDPYVQIDYGRNSAAAHSMNDSLLSGGTPKGVRYQSLKSKNNLTFRGEAAPRIELAGSSKSNPRRQRRYKSNSIKRGFLKGDEPDQGSVPRSQKRKQSSKQRFSSNAKDVQNSSRLSGSPQKSRGMEMMDLHNDISQSYGSVGSNFDLTDRTALS